MVSLRTADGGRRNVYLGVYNSPKSREAYARLLQELETAPIPSRVKPSPAASNITVTELLLAFWRHAMEHYKKPDGTPTSEIHGFRGAVKITRDLYGSTLVREFNPLALKSIRQQLLNKKLSRKTINGRVARVRHIFKWGVGEAIVPPEVLMALTAVTGLQKGRSPAHDPDPIGPVDRKRVAATLPFVRPPVAGMIQVQLLTGMRP